MLFLDPPAREAEGATPDSTRAERAFGLSLVFSAVRCILQYVILPFVLPVFGFAADAAVPVVLAINLMAIVAILYSVRRMWRIDYKYKWQYLLVGAAALLILFVFLYADLNPGALSNI
jgi:ABC-type iron transport system FetAB permease component